MLISPALFFSLTARRLQTVNYTIPLTLAAGRAVGSGVSALPQCRPAVRAPEEARAESDRRMWTGRLLERGELEGIVFAC